MSMSLTTALINARIVLPPPLGAVWGTLRFARGRIRSLDQPPARRDHVVDVQGRAVYPGLINAHDHLELNHYPRSKFRPIYASAHDWGEDFLPRLAEPPYADLRKLPLRKALRIGAEKNRAAGVTTVAHHNPPHRELFRRTFPIQVVRRYGWAHSLHFTPPDQVVQAFRRTPPQAPFMIHVAEGTDSRAAGELAQLDRLGALAAHTLIVHGVGLRAADRARMLEVGAGLVWCPSTNRYLLGQTAQVADFAAAGRLALGSDSRLTADGDLLDELRAAAATGQIGPEALFRAVTTDAAALLHLPDRGALQPGLRADCFVADIPEGDPYAALLTLTPSQIGAVYVGGRLTVRS